jgi:UrcA family protein
MTSFNSSNEKVARAGITVAVALFTCLVANGASAEQPQVTQVTVGYSDLDLSKPAGAQTLYQRIKSAAAQVCGSRGHYTRLESRKLWRDCYDGAVANAVAQIDRPSLTALHKEAADRAARG